MRPSTSPDTSRSNFIVSSLGRYNCGRTANTRSAPRYSRNKNISRPDLRLDLNQVAYALLLISTAGRPVKRTQIVQRSQLLQDRAFKDDPTRDGAEGFGDAVRSSH